MADSRKATRAAQLLLAREFDIVPDGKWGSFTQKAYESVSPDLRSQVDELLREEGTDAVRLRAERLTQKATGKRLTSAPTDVLSAITAAAAEAGINGNVLAGFAKIESNFNPKAQNGSSRGLFQMQPAAWADAKRIVPDLPKYDVGVWDPVQASRAAAAYIKVLSRTLARQGFTDELTPATLYLAYQQGAGGLLDLWRASRDPSYRPRYVTPLTMRGNPPQDGLGVTTDPKAFYERWVSAVGKKISAS